MNGAREIIPIKKIVGLDTYNPKVGEIHYCIIYARLRCMDIYGLELTEYTITAQEWSAVLTVNDTKELPIVVVKVISNPSPIQLAIF